MEFLHVPNNHLSISLRKVNFISHLMSGEYHPTKRTYIKRLFYLRLPPIVYLLIQIYTLTIFRNIFFTLARGRRLPHAKTTVNVQISLLLDITVPNFVLFFYHIKLFYFLFTRVRSQFQACLLRGRLDVRVSIWAIMQSSFKNASIVIKLYHHMGIYHSMCVGVCGCCVHNIITP